GDLVDALASEGGLSDDEANRMVENALGVMGLPLGLCVNMKVDGHDRLIPMSVEEPSVVAAASFAAKLLRGGGGVHTEVTAPLMIGQIQLLDLPDGDPAEAILAEKAALLELANAGHPNLVAAGGGAVDLEIHPLPATDESDPCGPMTIVHLVVDVRDAMGANAINSMCERLAPRIEELTGARVGLRILSNLTDRRRVVARGRVPFTMLQGRGGDSPAQLARAIVEASVFAERDPYRAATHNKGIMNGIDSVLVAFGQDWRAVEAGAHAYAARDGRYTALAKWRVEGEYLVGTLDVPLAVGTVGGVARVHPTVKMSRLIARIDDAASLASAVAAVGLAQNLSALRALAAEGIQKGHMRLHARNVAVEAGATGADVEEVARMIADRGAVNLDAAKRALAERAEKRREASTIPLMYREAGVLLERFEELRQQHWPVMDELLNEVVEQSCPAGSTLIEMCRYHLETGGKRLRALLPLMVAEAFDTDPAVLRPFGAACEMLHNATLVHDDLQDGDLVRRGRMTVWNRYGIPQAINLGDAMFYFAVSLCQRLDTARGMREAVVRRLLLDTVLVIDGQEREFGLKTLEQPSLEDYFVMVEGKTSGLFALPMVGAAELCGADEAQRRDLAEAARHMGVLFQIQDDTLDLFGDKGRDQVGTDIAEGKRSALVVHAMTTLRGADRERLVAIVERERTETSADDIAEAIELLVAAGSRDFALDEIERRRTRALAVPRIAAEPRLGALVEGMCDLFIKPIRPLLDERPPQKPSEP
ncbi:MAG: hydroxymethylglutaryl-CoA reductase, degradative, partial [Myxococcota bacterium]